MIYKYNLITDRWSHSEAIQLAREGKLSFFLRVKNIEVWDACEDVARDFGKFVKEFIEGDNHVL